MKKILLGAVLILGVIGFYGDDAAAYGYVDCSNITEQCKNLNWGDWDKENDKSTGKGCDSLGSASNGHTPDELAALTAAAQTCHDYLNDKTNPTTSNPVTACRLACRDKVWSPQYCKKDSQCN